MSRVGWRTFIRVEGEFITNPNLMVYLLTNRFLIAVKSSAPKTEGQY